MSCGLRSDRGFWEWFWLQVGDMATLGSESSELLSDIGLIPLPHGVVCEVGLGDGRNLPALRQTGREIIGLDVSSRALLRARRRQGRHVQFRAVVGATDSLPLATGACALLVAADLINHLEHPSTFVEQVHRVLCGNGVLLANAISVRDPGRDKSTADAMEISTNCYRCSWNPSPNVQLSWTMQYFDLADLTRLFEGFDWIVPLREYERTDGGHVRPFNVEVHRHVFWKILVRKPRLGAATVRYP